MNERFSPAFFVMVYRCGVLIAAVGCIGLVVLLARDWRKRTIW